MMRGVLVCGGSGQVGQELARQAWPAGFKPHFPTRLELDISNRSAIASYFKTNGLSLAAVINCGAFTAVDKAESDPGEAFGVNAQGPAWLAEECRHLDLPLIHVSTDYVFDGSSSGSYREDDRPAPLGVYGSSKLAGEIAVLASNPRTIVLRTSWVIGVFGNNFLKTMLRLGAERPELRVVADQVGCPTAAGDIARTLIAVCDRLVSDPDSPTGHFHFVNSGEASWWELAVEIFRQSSARGGSAPEVRAITTEEYPTPARRPANSRLATERLQAEFGIKPRHWRNAVAEIVNELLPAGSGSASMRGSSQ